MDYNPQESRENTRNTMGNMLRGIPVLVPWYWVDKPSQQWWQMKGFLLGIPEPKHVSSWRSLAILRRGIDPLPTFIYIYIFIVFLTIYIYFYIHLHIYIYTDGICNIFLCIKIIKQWFMIPANLETWEKVAQEASTYLVLLLMEEILHQLIHPGRWNDWNLQPSPIWKGKWSSKTSMIVFHVHLQGCRYRVL